MPENRFGVLKTEIVLGVAVCDILDNRPDPIEVVRQKPLFHLTAEQIAEDPAELIRLAAALERGSEHPLAKAVVEYADERNTVKAASSVSMRGKSSK